jgi:O-antigen/teichoic acid export membrane protein
VPTRLVQPTFMAEGRARSAAGWGVIRSLLTVLATLVPAAAGWGATGVLAALCTITAALFAAMLVQGVRHYGGAENSTTDALPSMREITAFALPLGLTDWVNILNKSLDRYLVMGFFPTPVYADYQVGAWQIPVVSTLPYAVGNVSLPEYKRRMAAGDAESMIQLWRASIAQVSLVVVPIAFAFMTVATPFIEVVFTADYLAAVPIFQWYTVLLLGRVSYYGAPILASGQSGWLLWASAFTLVSNFAISLPLCWWWGATGPAAGTALAFIPTVMLYCAFISRATGVPFGRIFPFFAWARVVLHGIAAAGVGLLVLRATDGPAWLELLAGLITVLGSYAAFGTATGLLGATEWAFVRDWIRLRVLRDAPQAPRGLP